MTDKVDHMSESSSTLRQLQLAQHLLHLLPLVQHFLPKHFIVDIFLHWGAPRKCTECSTLNWDMNMMKRNVLKQAAAAKTDTRNFSLKRSVPTHPTTFKSIVEPDYYPCTSAAEATKCDIRRVQSCNTPHVQPCNTNGDIRRVHRPQPM